ALHKVDGVQVTEWPGTEVDRAAFEPEAGPVHVTLVTGETFDLALTDERNRSFTQTLRARVQNSVVNASSTQLEHGTTVRVAVRRASDGVLSSPVIAVSALGLSDPATAAVVDDLESRVRQAAGLL